jgi:hypothetical protein
MPHEAVTVRRQSRDSSLPRGICARAAAIPVGLALLALLALLAIAQPSSAQTKTVVEQCVADHVAGQEVRLQNHLLEARSHFRACAQARCPAVIAKACTDFLRELEPRIPSVVPVVRDEKGNDVIDGALLLDGAAVPLGAWGKAREVEPGAHELTFDRGGQVVARKTVMISEGEKNRRLELTVTTAMQEPPAAPSDPLRTVGWIGIGLGTTAIAGSIVLWSVASTEHAELKETCAPTCDEGAVAGPKTKALAGDVLLGSGLALLAAGSLAVLLPREPAGAPPNASALPYFVINGRGAAIGLVVKAF